MTLAEYKWRSPNTNGVVGIQTTRQYYKYHPLITNDTIQLQKGPFEVRWRGLSVQLRQYPRGAIKGCLQTGATHSRPKW